MNEGQVTTEGVEGARPPREATTGVHVGVPAVSLPAAGGPALADHRDGDGPAASARRGERRRRDEAAFTSYYGLPVLNKPVWEARDIAGYLFLGGLAGAGAAMGAGAQVTGRPTLARTAKVGAAGAAGLSLAALVHDLGRPSRFANMLRVFKVSSPMNVGSWLLAGFAPAAFAAAASDLTGTAPALGAVATAGAAVLGPMVAAYTAALVSNTAVPAWHDGWRELPFVFVASGASAAAGLGLIGAATTENAPARRLAVLSGPAEIALSKLMERRMGMTAEPYHQGRAGRLMRLGELLTAAGSLAATAAGRDRRIGIGAGVALLAGSAAARFGIFHAGVQSAEDPRYTVVPQRRRLADAG